MMKVGGAGFIGGALREILLQEFLEVRVLDNGLIQQRIAAVDVGANADQVALALKAGVQLFEATYGIKMLGRNQIDHRP